MTLFLSAGLAGACHLVAQEKPTTLPDAQVEANVLKALAGAPGLADQSISTTTVFGTVTITGSVRDEVSRDLAEHVVANTPGVRKVVDELTIGGPAAAVNDNRQPQTSEGPPVDQQPAQRPSYGSSDRSPFPPSDSRQQYRGEQRGGEAVVVPAGTGLRVRLNEGIQSKTATPGMPFDGVVLSDVVAGGSIAIPRGAEVQGMVVDVQNPGQLKGRGVIVLKLTQLTLGGRIYPIATNFWSYNGVDKIGNTVGNTVGIGSTGAVIGAIAGGGPGAAVGAGVGSVAGLGVSSASRRGDAQIPAEAIVNFRLTQQAELTTVSQAELNRLGSGIPVGGTPAMGRRYPPPPPPPPSYYGPYFGPVFIPRW